MTLDARRRFFAEELEAVCRLRSPLLVEAFATVPREAFLRPGPWTVLADIDYSGGATGGAIGRGAPVRLTPDDDPARVCHNIAVAIDPARQLFNGQPGTLAVLIDVLELAPGARVLHVGHVVAIEVDGTLAAEARENLAATPWVEVRHGNASEPLHETFDAILINAGVTHPLNSWLDALASGGRMVLPLTATMPAMGPTIGKGLVLALTLTGAGEYAARVLSVVAIYSAEGVRDDALNGAVGAALMDGPIKWNAVTRLRRDAHAISDACWLHGPTCCFGRAV